MTTISTSAAERVSAETRGIRARVIGAFAVACAFLFSWSLAGAAGSGDAGPVLRMDLQRAVTMALDRNFEIQVESFGPEIARARQLQESGRFDPSLDFRAERQEEKGPGVGGLAAGPFGEDPARVTDTFSGGVQGLLPWGMRYNFGADTVNQRGDYSTWLDSYSTFAGVNVAQPLLRGGGFAANLSGIRIARLGYAVSEWQFRDRVTSVASRTADAYHDVLIAREAVAVALKSLSLAEQLLEDNTRRAEIGVMSPLDITSARAELARRKEGLILAQRDERAAENALKQLVTDEIAGLLAIRLELEPFALLPVPSEPLMGAVGRALRWRPDYRQALLDIQQRKIRVVFQRNEVLPQIDLEASYGLNGIDASLGDTVDRLSAQESPEWTAGVVFRMPIPNRDARGRLESAKLEVARALIDLKRLEQQILVEVDDAASRIRAAVERVAATREARSLAQERLDAETEKLRAGTSTSFVVLQLQRDLVEAEVALLRAVADHNRSVTAYDELTAGTLDKYRVRMDVPALRGEEISGPLNNGAAGASE